MTLRRDSLWALFDTLVVLGLMLASETLLLHVWGTTPGKALFGLRIVREDGSLLSLEQSFRRNQEAKRQDSYAITPVPMDEIALTNYALLYGRLGNWSISRANQSISGYKARSFHYDLPSVQLDCTLEYSGFRDSGSNSERMWALEDEPQSYSFSYTASLERAEQSLALILG